jgi:phage head maturation protease
MTMIRKVMPAQITALGEDEVQVIISTGQVARDEHIFEPGGAQIDNYRKNPVVLWNHMTEHPPVGRGEDLQVGGDNITARVRFAPMGISVKADEIRGLVKAGFINAVSVGIEPIEAEPLDPKKPRGGQRVSKWELMEFSFCNIPVDTGSVVTARAKHSDDWKVGASRTLPVDDSDAWDGTAAEASIFELAGGDDFDPSKARKGFLIYNASKPKERGSYKLPIAHAVNGRMKVPNGAIRAAASRLSQTAIPQGVKDSAQKLLDHYKEQSGMSAKDSDGDRGLKVKHTRALERAPAVPSFKRGLYDVAQLCYMLQSLGFCHESAEYETALEGDESPVPGMLGEALTKFGEALIAMAQEEVKELLDDVGDDDSAELETGDLPMEARAYIAAGKTPRARTWRRGIAMARAGKALSTSNAKTLGEAQGHVARAMKHQRAATEHNQAVGDQLDTCRAFGDKAVKASGQVGESLAAAKDDPENAASHVAKATRAQKTVDGNLSDLAQAHNDATDRAQDVGDSHNGIGRCLKSTDRCVRAVVEGSTPGEDSDSQDTQKPNGEDNDDDSSRSHTDFRRRQADLRELMPAA